MTPSVAPMSRVELSEGDELLGQFVIRRVLGRGGHATVYEADHRPSGETLALKAVPTFGHGDLVVQLLAAEQRAQKLVRDREHVLEGSLPLKAEARGLEWVLLPMEKAELSFRDWLRGAVQLDQDDRLDEGLLILRQVCRGAAALHGAGLVHRDLKPENVLLMSEMPSGRKDDKPKWRAKIADFGLARGLEPMAGASPDIPLDGIGTPAYMAPEQLLTTRSKNVREPADIYAIGTMLYELLDGEAPYAGSAAAICQKKQNRELDSGIARPAGPIALADLAMRCLERDPEKRPASAEEVLRLLSSDPEEEKAYGTAATSDTVAGWKEFLNAWPNGWRRAEAEAALAKAEQRERAAAEAERARREEEERRAAAEKEKAAEAKRKADEQARREREERERKAADEERRRRKREPEAKRKADEEEARRRAGGFRPAERSTRWYPAKVAPEQESEARRLGVPAAIEHEATGMVLVLIPGGEFLMGASESDGSAMSSESPQHRVSVDPFYIGVAPVTQGQWKKVMGANPSHFKGTHQPVEQVSWDDAQRFLAKAGGKGLRLPTEAEWERAARGGRTTRYWWGEQYSRGMANCDESLIDGAYLRQTTEVGRFEANPWGLWDVHGNVWEWCADWYSDEYYKVSTGRNPKGPGSGTYRVLRGGSCGVSPEFLRASYRDDNAPDFRYDYIGFRCVRDVFP